MNWLFWHSEYNLFLISAQCYIQIKQEKCDWERGWKCSCWCDVPGADSLQRDMWYFFMKRDIILLLVPFFKFPPAHSLDLLFDSQNISFPMANISWMVMFQHFLFSSAMSVFLKNFPYPTCKATLECPISRFKFITISIIFWSQVVCTLPGHFLFMKSEQIFL